MKTLNLMTLSSSLLTKIREDFLVGFVFTKLGA